MARMATLICKFEVSLHFCCEKLAQKSCNFLQWKSRLEPIEFDKTARLGFPEDVPTRWKTSLQHCGCIEWDMHRRLGCTSLRTKVIAKSSMSDGQVALCCNYTLTLYNFEVYLNCRSFTWSLILVWNFQLEVEWHILYPGAGVTDWRILWVQWTVGCGNLGWMVKMFSSGYAFSATTSTESSRRQQTHVVDAKKFKHVWKFVVSIPHCSYWKLVAAHPWQVQDWRGNCACFILYMFDLACQIFLYLFGGHTNRGWWIEISLWSTFGGSWTHVGTLGYYWVRGLEGLQFKVLRSKYEYVVHFCPPSIVSEQRQPAYAKRAWCIFESYVLSSVPRYYGNYRRVHSRLVDSSRWMFNKILCCSNQTCFLFSSMIATFTSKVCIEQRLPMTIILPSSAESFFKETVESGPRGWLVWLWTCCYVGIQLVSSFLHHKYSQQQCRNLEYSVSLDILACFESVSASDLWMFPLSPWISPEFCRIFEDWCTPQRCEQLGRSGCKGFIASWRGLSLKKVPWKLMVGRSGRCILLKVPF